MSTNRILVPDGAVMRSAEKADFTAVSHGGNMFLEAMLEMPTTNAHDSRKPLKMLVSMAIHTVLIAALIIIPILFATNTLSIAKMETTYVFTPPPPAAPPPPMAAAAPRAAQTAPKIAQPTVVVAPHVIPKQISTTPSTGAAPDVLADAGVSGGVPGGVPGGVLGGILGGTGVAVGPPPPTIAHSGVVRVGGNVKPPELMQQIQPEYPAVAKAARVSGTVVIDAVIDTNGNVISEHAVSGPNLLIEAALAAVQQWKYQPTVLNGQPVDLAMEVTVSFHLG